MNISDFEAPEAPETWEETIVQIFTRQRELMDRYKEIEKLPDPPVSLHHPNGQRIIRDFAWRATEEMAESFEAWTSWMGRHETTALIHQCEELADALHFLTELMIFAGIGPEQMPPFPVSSSNDVTMGEYYWNATYQLGVAMNFLRNKSWKQHHVPTDVVRFKDQLICAFAAHLEVWANASGGLKSSDLHSFYFRKSQVNRFRQRSNY